MSDSPTSFLPEHPPVTDWVNDFDHTDPRWTENPFPIWEQLRAASPVVHTERFLGCYMPTTYQAVKEIAYDTEHFSSRRVIVRDTRPEITTRAPPITSDPPEHKPAKQLLLPPFTPDAMTKLEPRVRAICNELIDEFIADGKCDAAARYTKHILMTAVKDMTGYFAGHLEQRKRVPTDDLISTLMKAKGPDGQPLPDEHVLGSLRLLLI